jgi:hypothetical protein
MVDPRLVLILLSIYGVYWGVGKGVEVTKKVAHGAKHVAAKIVHPHKHRDDLRLNDTINEQ